MRVRVFTFPHAPPQMPSSLPKPRPSCTKPQHSLAHCAPALQEHSSVRAGALPRDLCP